MPAARRFTRAMILRRVIALCLLLGAVAVAWWIMIRMPGRSFRGPLPPLSPPQLALRDELAADVQKLAGDIGERNVENYPKLVEAADWIEQSFAAAGYRVRRDSYLVSDKRCDNLEVELRGTGPEILVVGAHYDSVFGAPGANDNGSGVAATLALARRFAGRPLGRTLRFVAFVNEEPGHFQTEQMGSWVYARGCRERGDRIAGMISLETVGYFSSEPGSQRYPVPILDMIYPKSGNFIAFVGNLGSRHFMRDALRTFRREAQFPSEGAALPEKVPGTGWSDHWSFWQHGYPAFMVTDTAPFRYPHYHRATDTPSQIDYESMARVVSGMESVIADWAKGGR